MKAKTKFTRLWSILLALVMVVGMLPTVALAAEPATADFTSGDGTAALALLNAAKTTGAADSTWDGNTLTLNGVNFTTTAATAVKLPEGAKIVLAAGTTNTITGGDLAIGVSSWVECYGIYAEDGLTIEGTGKLTVTGGNATGSNKNAMSYGIYAKSGEVSITGGTVEANGGTVTVTGNQITISCGIGASENVTISSGVVTAIGGTVTSTDGNATGKSHGIFSRDVSISSPAIVIAKGGTTNNQSYGIYAVKGVTISGAVEATGDTVSSLYGTSCGIGASENVTISGTAVVSAKGGNATGVSGNSNGIYANINVTISGGTVRATGGTASSGNSYGIFAFQNVSIQDTADVTVNVTATGGTAKPNSYGIYSIKDVSITDSTVYAEGGKSTVGSYGIYKADRSLGNLTISGTSVVTATGGEVTGGVSTYSYGICSNNKVTISNTATVTAKGGETTKDNYTCSFGIYAYNGLTISGGTVTAEAGTAETDRAFDKSPSISISPYWWRTSKSDEYTQFSDSASAYPWSAAHTYVEIRDTEPAAATTYTVTVTGGTADVSKAAADTTVTLKANDAPSGKVFDKWVVESGSASITLADANSAKTTFTMPAGNVTVTATYKDAPHTHSYGSEWKIDANKHWHECSCKATSGEAAHTAGDWIIGTAATVTTAGTKYKKCTTCGYVMETGTIPATGGSTPSHKPSTQTENYRILDGAGSTWTQNTNGSLSIRGNGAFSKFVGVKVDGVMVSSKHYTVREGSTIVTLKAEYLSTIAAGSHTIQLLWKDGSASTTFNIDVNSPDTGDNGLLSLWTALFVVSGVAVLAASPLGRKKTNQAE